MVIQITIEWSIDAVVDVIHGWVEFAILTDLAFWMDSTSQCIGGWYIESPRFSDDFNIWWWEVQIHTAIHNWCNLWTNLLINIILARQKKGEQTWMQRESTWVRINLFAPLWCQCLYRLENHRQYPTDWSGSQRFQQNQIIYELPQLLLHKQVDPYNRSLHGNWFRSSKGSVEGDFFIYFLLKGIFCSWNLKKSSNFHLIFISLKTRKQNIKKYKPLIPMI